MSYYSEKRLGENSVIVLCAFRYKFSVGLQWRSDCLILLCTSRYKISIEFYTENGLGENCNSLTKLVWSFALRKVCLTLLCKLRYKLVCIFPLGKDGKSCNLLCSFRYKISMAFCTTTRPQCVKSDTKLVWTFRDRLNVLCRIRYKFSLEFTPRKDLERAA